MIGNTADNVRCVLAGGKIEQVFIMGPKCLRISKIKAACTIVLNEIAELNGVKTLFYINGKSVRRNNLLSTCL